MSDDEYYEAEVTSQTSKKGDEAFAKAKHGVKKGQTIILLCLTLYIIIYLYTYILFIFITNYIYN